MHDHRRVFHVIVRHFVHWLYGVVCAFQFLTRIPIPVSVPFNEAVGRRSTFFYPLVGFVLGVGLVIVANLGMFVFHPAIVAVAVVLFWTIYSGGLHLDGLMDTADALYSNKNQQEMLDIMRDSRVGAIGSLHAILVILWKTAIVYSMLDEGIQFFAFCLIAVPVLSRCLLVWVIASFPYARGNSGMGAFLKDVGHVEMLGSSCIALFLLILSGWIYYREPLVVIVIILFLFILVTSVFSLFMTRIFMRKFGGLTGDTYGYLVEMVEGVLLATAWILITTVVT